MGIFDKIKHAIFGGPANAAQAAPTAGAGAPSAPAATPAASSSSASSTSPATAAPSAPPAPASVDVSAILDQAVAKSGQKLDWRHSIVDLMKALKMDATLAERKELATELHFTGDMQDSAAMNTWLRQGTGRPCGLSQAKESNKLLGPAR
jgi:soluble lytic murein transglycosylase-like protein